MFALYTQRDGLATNLTVLSVLGGDERVDRLSGPASVRQSVLESWPDDGHAGGSVATIAASLWPEVEAGSLFARAVREARGSNLFVGDAPETWSPLAPTTAEMAGQLMVEETLIDTYVEARRDLAEDASTPPPRGDMSARARFDLVHFDGGVMTTLADEDGVGQGAVIFFQDAFVAACPPREGPMLFQFSPDTGVQQDAVTQARAVLAEYLPDGEVTTLLLWRAYSGSNTITVDGIVEIIAGAPRRLALAATRTAGLVVGRLAFAIHARARRPRRDPTAGRRRLRLEAGAPDIAARCPNLDQAPNVSLAVVAVHGTMACAVPLASALRDLVPADQPVFRYEHDTWTGVSENARDLAAQISRIGATEVLLVAHSRGGLVAREAAVVLSGQGVTTRVITLGTPFLGTPLIGGVRGGLLGVNTLLGAIRVIPGGGVLDAGTRLAGLVLKRELPEGIAAMDSDSAYLRLYRNLPEQIQSAPVTTAFAGTVDPSSATDRYGLALLEAFGREGFAADDNDLVVGTRSASMDGAIADHRTIHSDHFSYLLDEEVRDCLRHALDPLLTEQVPDSVPVMETTEAAPLSGSRTPDDKHDRTRSMSLDRIRRFFPGLQLIGESASRVPMTASLLESLGACEHILSSAGRQVTAEVGSAGDAAMITLHVGGSVVEQTHALLGCAAAGVAVSVDSTDAAAVITLRSVNSEDP